MNSAKSLPGWKQIPIGAAITKAGNSVERRTGDWRVFRPVINQDKCIRCYLCWVYCPEPAIRISEKTYAVEIDYEHCKGCGICAEECPAKAIELVEEVK